MEYQNLQHYLKQIANPEIKNIDFSGEMFEGNQLEILATAIKHHNITSLNLYNCNFTNTSFEHLAKFIDNCPHLKSLNLGKTNLNSSSLSKMAESLKKAQNLHEINLSHNPLHDIGCSTALGALSHCTKIKIINMNSVNMNHESKKAMSHFLQNNRSLKILSLDGNSNLSSICMVLGKFLSNNHPLNNLSMIQSNISAKALIYFAQNIQSNKIRKLSISGNHLNHDKAIEFFNNLKRFTELNLLDIRYCNLQETHAFQVLKSISQITTLEHLCISFKAKPDKQMIETYQLFLLNNKNIASITIPGIDVNNFQNSPILKINGCETQLHKQIHQFISNFFNKIDETKKDLYSENFKPETLQKLPRHFSYANLIKYVMHKNHQFNFDHDIKLIFTPGEMMLSKILENDKMVEAVNKMGQKNKFVQMTLLQINKSMKLKYFTNKTTHAWRKKIELNDNIDNLTESEELKNSDQISKIKPFSNSFIIQKLKNKEKIQEKEIPALLNEISMQFYWNLLFIHDNNLKNFSENSLEIPTKEFLKQLKLCIQKFEKIFQNTFVQKIATMSTQNPTLLAP